MELSEKESKIAFVFVLPFIYVSDRHEDSYNYAKEIVMDWKNVSERDAQIKYLRKLSERTSYADRAFHMRLFSMVVFGRNVDILQYEWFHEVSNEIAIVHQQIARSGFFFFLKLMDVMAFYHFASTKTAPYPFCFEKETFMQYLPLVTFCSDSVNEYHHYVYETNQEMYHVAPVQFWDAIEILKTIGVDVPEPRTNENEMMKMATTLIQEYVWIALVIDAAFQSSLWFMDSDLNSQANKLLDHFELSLKLESGLSICPV
jgi:hypothetical protein